MNRAVKLDAKGTVENVILVDQLIPDDYELVLSPVGIGEFLSDAVKNKSVNDAREQRNALLASSDWTQVADAPVDQAAWATYRQALRDVPDQAGFPEDINWPVAPE